MDALEGSTGFTACARTGDANDSASENISAMMQVSNVMAARNRGWAGGFVVRRGSFNVRVAA